ncbi:DUF397 domain-containing protein [Streptomyces sp. ISID311]|nr:DUF397 domain-containing protein [Streptomyces sp. ISID311]TXC96059.1 DUF397 domain-containing protein [Streptomyces sp. ISID311]
MGPEATEPAAIRVRDCEDAVGPRLVFGAGAWKAKRLVPGALVVIRSLSARTQAPSG